MINLFDHGKIMVYVDHLFKIKVFNLGLGVLAGPCPVPGWPLVWPWLALGLALLGPWTSPWLALGLTLAGPWPHGTPKDFLLKEFLTRKIYYPEQIY